MTTDNNYAVFNQRKSGKDKLDDFPTPPWATRALIEHVIGRTPQLSQEVVWEPACGRGYMAGTLLEYFGAVKATDINDYGYGQVEDFLNHSELDYVDWVITNPPYKVAEAFVHEALKITKGGVAVLCRTNFLEGVGRYTKLFKDNPPQHIAQFVERVPMVEGRVDPNASTATAYAWFVWTSGPRLPLHWIPPCRKQLEREQDYLALPIHWVNACGVSGNESRLPELSFELLS